MKNETIPYGKLLFIIWVHLFLLRDTLGIASLKKNKLLHVVWDENGRILFHPAK
jgi:hypothetical protein